MSHAWTQTKPSDVPPVFPPGFCVHPTKYPGYVPYSVHTPYTAFNTYTTTTHANFGLSQVQKTVTTVTESVHYMQLEPQGTVPCVKFLHPFIDSTMPDAPVDEHQIGNERKNRLKEHRRRVRFNPIVEKAPYVADLKRQPSPPSIGSSKYRKEKNQNVLAWLDKHAEFINESDPFDLSRANSTSSSSFKI